MRSSVSSFGRSAPYDRSERFGGPNRFGGGGGPAPMSRMSRYRSKYRSNDSSMISVIWCLG